MPLAGLFGIAVLARISSWPEIFTQEGVLLADGDAYYHMWRIWHCVTHFPSILETDGYMNFPMGAQVPWPPGFDWVTAALIRFSFGTEDVEGAEILGAWLPVLLGAATVVVAALLSARTFSWTAGFATGLILAVLPAARSYTQLGFLDHHAAVALIGTLLLGGAMRVAAHPGHGPRAWPVAAGVLVAAAMLTWAGILIHVAVLQAALVTWLLLTKDAALASARALRLAGAHALSALLVLPFGYGHSFGAYSQFTPLGLSNFQPTWFAAGAVCLAAVNAAWRISVLGKTRGRRLLSSAAAGVGGLGLAFLVLPDLTDVLARAADWFSADQTFNQRITELTPYLAGDWMRAQTKLSYLLYGFPLVCIGMLLADRRAPDRWLLLAWSIGFCLATLSQSRFINTFVVAFALIWGGAVGASATWARRRLGGDRVAKGSLAAAGLAVAGVLLSPIWPFYALDIEVIRAKRAHSPSTQRDAAFRSAARWLEQASPEAVHPNDRPEYGVLAPWGLGHLIRYYSRRPMIQDNFGPYAAPENVEHAARYFAEDDEDAAAEILESLGARYVITDIAGAGTGEPYSATSMTRRMVRMRGRAAQIGTGSQATLVPALARHRLIFEAGVPSRPVQVWELVKGAEVTGRARPGARVTVALQMSFGDRPFPYLIGTTADETGHYALRVPYPSEDFGAEAKPLGDFVLRSAGVEAEFSVTDEQVRAGVSLEAPPLL